MSAPKNQTRSRALSLVVALVIGALCLVFAVRNVDLDKTGAALANISAGGIAGYLGLIILMFIVRSWRWAIQVEGLSGERPKPVDALAICAVAFAAVFLLPFRLGEFVRPFLSERKGYMTMSAGLANSLVERITDGLITTACFAGVLFALRDQGLPDVVQSAAIGGFVLFGGATAASVVALIWQDASLQFWRRALFFLPETVREALVGLLAAFIEGLKCFRSVSAGLLYVVLSLAFWAINGVALYVLLVDLAPGFTLVGAYFTICFMVIAVMIPAPPGNVGNFHYFTKLALTLVGVSAETGLAGAVAAHALQIVALVLWAGLFVVTGRVSLKSVRDATLAGADDAQDVGKS